MKGIVVFKHENIGSKSEGNYPYLYLKNAEFLRIWRENDYSLFCDQLKEFDGRYVSLDGYYNEYENFVISKIEIAAFEEEQKEKLLETSDIQKDFNFKHEEE